MASIGWVIKRHLSLNSFTNTHYEFATMFKEGMFSVTNPGRRFMTGVQEKISQSGETNKYGDSVGPSMYLRSSAPLRY